VRLSDATTVNDMIINGKQVPVSSAPCAQFGGICVAARVHFAGSSSLRFNSLAAPVPKPLEASYNASITVTSAMLTQLKQRQREYNISWTSEDLDASWLAPSRLLLYVYIARPSPSLADPIVLVDGVPASLVRQYNSRGNHAIVPPGGGAVSGDTAKTFLGWYVDCSHLSSDVEHRVSVTLPWSLEEQREHTFKGLFWHNIEDAVSNEVHGLPSVMFV
jgi:hypothetical protein